MSEKEKSSCPIIVQLAAALFVILVLIWVASLILELGRAPIAPMSDLDWQTHWSKTWKERDLQSR